MDTTTIPVQRQRNEVRLGGSEGGSGEDYRVFVPNGQHILHVGVDLNSFIRDPSFSPKKIYFRQTFAFLRFIFRRSTLYLCVPCMLCFVHVNGFFFTGKHKIEISLFVSMCLLLNC